MLLFCMIQGWGEYRLLGCGIGPVTLIELFNFGKFDTRDRLNKMGWKL